MRARAVKEADWRRAGALRRAGWSAAKVCECWGGEGLRGPACPRAPAAAEAYRASSTVEALKGAPTDAGGRWAKEDAEAG